MHKSIYLTGAPGTGKSTLLKSLHEENSNIKVFEYGKEMASHLSHKINSTVDQSTMKSGIETLVAHEDINIINKKMKLFIDEHISDYHVIVDTHQITKEEYGFKLKAFSLAELTQLRIDEIWVLYCNSETIKNRLLIDSGGRPIIEDFESDFHTFTQANLAITYSMIKDIPIIFFNSNDINQNYKLIMLNRLYC